MTAAARPAPAGPVWSIRLTRARKDICSSPHGDASFAAMQTAVLLAEPEPASRTFLARHLADDGFDVVGATGGAEALELAEASKPDLVLLGNTLPEVSPLELCRRIRDGEPGRSWNRDVPLIVLGANGADAVDRVRAFDRGADDFLARPFVYDELLARIRAILRRTRPHAGEHMLAGDIEIDCATRSVRVRGERVMLAGKEYELLVKLAGDPTRVFTKD